MSFFVDDSHIQSLAKGLAVIRTFRPGADRLTISEVASGCNLTRAGARRILFTLQDLGYVAIEGRHFFLTSRVMELAEGFLNHSVWEAARPLLQQVVDALDEAAAVGVLEGFEVVYTLRLRSPRLLHLEFQRGADVPAHASSVGRVLLAALPAHELRRYLDQATFTRFTVSTVCDANALAAELADVRQKGWCHVNGEVDEGVSSIAVPVRNAENRVFAAVCLGTTSERVTPGIIESKVVPTLQAAADAISSGLRGGGSH